ncbi:MAG: hypothetical protein IJX62_03540, partial [Clostridia bacterium]|nr:hypothetical protein [Clostridia bacterium]
MRVADLHGLLKFFVQNGFYPAAGIGKASLQQLHFLGGKLGKHPGGEVVVLVGLGAHAHTQEGEGNG